MWLGGQAAGWVVLWACVGRTHLPPDWLTPVAEAQLPTASQESICTAHLLTLQISVCVFALSPQLEVL